MFVKFIDVRKGIEHYTENCGKTEGLRKDQIRRAAAFGGDDYKERIKNMTEEEKKNEVNFAEYKNFYDHKIHENFSYDY